MKVLITGTSGGIGSATAALFLEKGHTVVGLDTKAGKYTDIIADVAEPALLPEIDGVEILITCAGVQNASGTRDDIDINLKGTINTVEKYGFGKLIKSILMIASSSAHTGAEFPLYSASKGGILAYMRNVAIRLAPRGVTCNSISPGGVKTELNKPVTDDPGLWKKIMDVTPMKKWAEPEEIAKWCFFLTVENRSCSGQDILIDNGETNLNACFVWPEGR